MKKKKAKKVQKLSKKRVKELKERELIDGNTACAFAVKLCRVESVPAFPITPQTELMERLAEWTAAGKLDAYLNVMESEHSVLSAAVGSEMTETRTFVSSGSQGLMLMHEILPIAAGTRMPIVMVCGSRAISAPIALWCFTEDAEVLMADLSYKKISSVKEGDVILGMKNSCLVPSKVKKTFEHESNDIVKIKTPKFEIECTKDHKFYHHPTHTHWVQAKSLKNKELKWIGWGFDENAEYKKGWLKGVIDGDGCWSSVKVKGRKYSRFEIHVNDREIIERLVKYCIEAGFRIREHKYREKMGQFGAIISESKEAERFKEFLKENNGHDFCRGYLGGIYDAEGTGPYAKRKSIRIYNKNAEIIQKIEAFSEIIGLNCKKYFDDEQVAHLLISNAPEFFVKCFPATMRKRNNIFNSTYKAIKTKIKIDYILPIQEKKTVYNLETETNNYFVNGFLVHNCDHNDFLSCRDFGWLMLSAEINQELLDFIIIAYKVGENKNVLLPTLIEMDGFVLSETREPVEIPKQETTDKFLPALKLEAKLDVEKPMTLGTPVLEEYQYFKEQMQTAQANALKEFEKAFKEWKALTGRGYGFVEKVWMEDARLAIVMIGANATIAKAAVRKLRSEGKKVGLLKLRVLRPWPEKTIKKALKNCKKIAVVDQNVSLGKNGILYNEICETLKDEKKIVSNYIAGLGGKHLSIEDFENIFKDLEKAKSSEKKWLT